MQLNSCNSDFLNITYCSDRGVHVILELINNTALEMIQNLLRAVLIINEFKGTGDTFTKIVTV